MRFQFIWLLTLLLLSATRGNASDKRKTSQRIGDLVVTLIGFEERENQTSGDHHTAAVQLQAENVGKQALCVTFRATLKTTFSLQYRGFSSSSYPFRISELLPGEKVEGEYEFLVKNGVEPLQFLLAPTSQTQACTGGRESFSSIFHASDEVKFDLTKPSGPSEAEKAVSANGQQAETSSVRVYLTVTKGGATEASAMKSFHEHCPQLQLTTEKERADYIVELKPATFRQSKNAATVTNSEGDVIYSGATFSLGNAAKDACGAILNRLDSGQKH